MKNTVPLILVLFVVFLSKNTGAQMRFGVFADCQYCDCETMNNRFYRNSLLKLEDAITHFNQNEKLQFVVNLGDLIDRDIESFNPVNSILEKSEKPVFHVIGNHDLEVEKEQLKFVPEKMGMRELYYSFEKQNWKFIFLNGNGISFLSTDPETVKQAEKMTQKLQAEGQPNFHSWNGGIDSGQLSWLNSQLKNAENKGKKVAIFCHYPLLPLESHTLWNSEEVISILEHYSCVKLWMNGHNHAGNYAFQNGIHFINLKGMVESETENAFAEVTLNENAIEIKGFGSEKMRTLPVK
jgi:manganese-dependent ADP-ribose/CDP-alcohol diphosphatase